MLRKCQSCGAESEYPYYCDNCGEVMDSSNAWWSRDTMELECCE